MNLQWILAGTGIMAAVVAFLWARRISRRIERLSQSYWELRYEHGQLNARVSRLEPPNDAEVGEASQTPSRPTTNFVPLSSLRK